MLHRSEGAPSRQGFAELWSFEPICKLRSNSSFFRCSVTYYALRRVGNIMMYQIESRKHHGDPGPEDKVLNIMISGVMTTTRDHGPVERTAPSPNDIITPTICATDCRDETLALSERFPTRDCQSICTWGSRSGMKRSSGSRLSDSSSSSAPNVSCGGSFSHGGVPMVRTGEKLDEVRSNGGNAQSGGKEIGTRRGVLRPHPVEEAGEIVLILVSRALGIKLKVSLAKPGGLVALLSNLLGHGVLLRMRLLDTGDVRGHLSVAAIEKNQSSLLRRVCYDPAACLGTWAFEGFPLQPIAGKKTMDSRNRLDTVLTYEIAAIGGQNCSRSLLPIPLDAMSTFRTRSRESTFRTSMMLLYAETAPQSERDFTLVSENYFLSMKKQRGCEMEHVYVTESSGVAGWVQLVEFSAANFFPLATLSRSCARQGTTLCTRTGPHMYGAMDERRYAQDLAQTWLALDARAPRIVRAKEGAAPVSINSTTRCEESSTRAIIQQQLQIEFELRICLAAGVQLHRRISGSQHSVARRENTSHDRGMCVVHLGYLKTHARTSFPMRTLEPGIDKNSQLLEYLAPAVTKWVVKARTRLKVVVWESRKIDNSWTAENVENPAVGAMAIGEPSKIRSFTSFKRVCLAADEHNVYMPTVLVLSTYVPSGSYTYGWYGKSKNLGGKSVYMLSGLGEKDDADRRWCVTNDGSGTPPVQEMRGWVSAQCANKWTIRDWRQIDEDELRQANACRILMRCTKLKQQNARDQRVAPLSVQLIEHDWPMPPLHSHNQHLPPPNQIPASHLSMSGTMKTYAPHVSAQAHAQVPQPPTHFLRAPAQVVPMPPAPRMPPVPLPATSGRIITPIYLPVKNLPPL
ncbi:hypothetical protein BKA93DRAFT_882060 [Sparassis latifolia]